MNNLTSRLQKIGVSPQIGHYADSDPENIPVDVFRAAITDKLVPLLPDIEPQRIFAALDTNPKPDTGDLIIALPRFRLKEKNEEEVGKRIAAEFLPCDLIDRVESERKFLRFYFSKSKMPSLALTDILQRKENYGTNESGKGKKVIVEFSSPNIAKPFHAGHLRSTIIGAFLSNLHEACGWTVTRMNYLGDWGKQFGLLAVGFEMFGSEEKLEEDPIQHLFEVYVKINAVAKEDDSINDNAREYFRKMEEGDEAAKKIWQHFRDLSITKYKETYARLNIVYDVYSGESQVQPETMERASQMLKERNISKVDNGAVIIDFAEHGSKALGKTLIQKKDGTTLYLTRDIGAAMERFEKFKFDKMVYVVSSQQDLHVAQLFKILSLLNFDWAPRCVHINYGMVEGMSTRAGTVVFLDDILEQTRDKMHDVMRANEAKYAQVTDPDATADKVGISAVLVQDMGAKRINNYAFDWKRMFSFEGDTGPYLQYSHTRLASIFRNSKFTLEDIEHADFSLLSEPAAINVCRLLLQYPDAIRNAMKTQEPSAIVTFLFKLTHLLNSAYDQLWVMNQKPELAQARLALYVSARYVLGSGMRLLGLVPIDRFVLFPDIHHG